LYFLKPKPYIVAILWSVDRPSILSTLLSLEQSENLIWSGEWSPWIKMIFGTCYSTCFGSCWLGQERSCM